MYCGNYSLRYNPYKDVHEYCSVCRPLGRPNKIIVEEGDSMYDISKSIFGWYFGHAWPLIYFDNKDVIANPFELVPSTVLDISKVRFNIFRWRPYLVFVRNGECLYTIAKRIYGNGNEWRKIYDANRFQLNDPDNMPSGMLLLIP